LKMSSVARRPHNLRAENIRKHYWYVWNVDHSVKRDNKK
jgi:hypothetical protein